MSVPLTSNRLIISLLISVEAVIIPSMLRRYGLSNTEALSIYGIINVMVKPFIMFPSTITNSLSVLLLPTISEAAATNNKTSIKRSTNLSIKYSLLIGILSTGIFLAFGQELGLLIYNNDLAGRYLTTFAWLCSFLYISTTFNSILNGLDKVHISFFSSVAGLSIRILIILLLTPIKGISAYFFALLISLLFTTIFEFLIIYKYTNANLNSLNIIAKPGLIVLISGYIVRSIYNYFKRTYNGIILILLFCSILCLMYIVLLVVTKVIDKRDFR